MSESEKFCVPTYKTTFRIIPKEENPCISPKQYGEHLQKKRKRGKRK